MRIVDLKNVRYFLNREVFIFEIQKREGGPAS